MRSGPAAVALIAALACLAGMAEAAPLAAEKATPVAQAAAGLRADYREQQAQRLAQHDDRDSLIAAVLLGLPNEIDARHVAGQAEAEQRLAARFGTDPLAAFTLALACQVRDEPCAEPERYDALLRLAPDNALHWLMLPNGAAPSDAQLHAAASTTHAESHLGALIGIVRTALADQPAQAVDGVDPHELALLLRREAVEQIPLPRFATTVTMCKSATAFRRADCIGVGRHLMADRGGTILTRMIGSAMLRRLLKGTPEEAAAKALRRDYVWFGEQLQASDMAYQEQLQIDTAVFGEWEAVQRSVERMVGSRTPPANWTPHDPQMLLLSEERTPPASAK
jgi:hypothetical protein